MRYSRGHDTKVVADFEAIVAQPPLLSEEGWLRQQ
jgi:hypothetical protein